MLVLGQLNIYVAQESIGIVVRLVLWSNKNNPANYAKRSVVHGVEWWEKKMAATVVFR